MSSFLNEGSFHLGRVNFVRLYWSSSEKPQKSLEFSGGGEVWNWVVIEEVVAADAEEVFLGFDAADLVFELRRVALSDEDEVLFHLLNVFSFDEVGAFSSSLFIELFDVGEDFSTGDGFDFFIGKAFPELFEDPWVADGASADHESGGFGLGVRWLR